MADPLVHSEFRGNSKDRRKNLDEGKKELATSKVAMEEFAGWS